MDIKKEIQNERTKIFSLLDEEEGIHRGVSKLYKNSKTKYQLLKKKFKRERALHQIRKLKLQDLRELIHVVSKVMDGEVWVIPEDPNGFYSEKKSCQFQTSNLISKIIKGQHLPQLSSKFVELVKNNIEVVDGELQVFFEERKTYPYVHLNGEQIVKCDFEPESEWEPLFEDSVLHSEGKEYLYDEYSIDNDDWERATDLSQPEPGKEFVYFECKVLRKK